MTATKDQAQTLFLNALELPSAEERAAYLDAHCGAESELRKEIDELLDHARRLGPFLEPSDKAADCTTALAITERPGTIIGPYKLLQQIGEGGMGIVFMAEQSEPIQRNVALKIITPGMDTRHVIARFEAERQAVAMMDHPNIAKVLDAGTTDSGRPYFVMELVKGVPITKYCDEKHLPLRARLELFTQVCQAVQHAHQKGIIHRDIKPNNVLVAEYDNRAIPKVIDFGVAKATAHRLTDRTMFTELGQILGTMEYMSPEQAKLNQLDVDTRSDIYSLGVLLYELLAGSTPFEGKRLKEAAFDEMLRIIREEEPPKPSTRASSSNALPSIAANRNLEPARLSKDVRGELDWIVMKALEKDRNRRYETASGFAADIERHLHDEPVEAGPPSRLYSFGKFSRRHKASIAVAATAALLLLAGVGGLVVTNRLVTRQKDQKETALARVLQEKQRADQNLARARQAVKEYLVKTATSPLLAKGDFQPLRKELFETAIPFYEEFAQQDQQNSSLDFERGRAYEDLGFLRMNIAEPERALEEIEKAEAIYRRLSATFPDQPMYRQQLADTYNLRGSVFRDLGRADSAETAFRQAIALSEALAAQPGATPESLESMARVANNLGVLLKDLGRGPESEAMLRTAIAAGEKLLQQQPNAIHRRADLVRAWLNLGTLLSSDPQREADAERAYQKGLELVSADWVQQLQASPTLVAEFQDLRAGGLSNLGGLRPNTGQWTEAAQSFRESLPIKQKLVEMFPSDPQYRRSLAGTFGNLATALDTLHQFEEAQAMHDKAIVLYEQLVAESPANVRYIVELAGEYANIGDAMVDRGQLDPALPVLARSIDTFEAAFRRDPRPVQVRQGLVSSHWAHAAALAELGRYSDASQDFDRALEMDDGRYQTELRLKRASNLLKLKDHVRAAADAAAFANNSAATAGDLYNAACVHALAAGVAHEDAGLAETYAARAVLLLRQARAKGFDDVAHIRSDSDLNAIRSRGDFQQFMKEVQADGSRRKGQ